MNALQFSKLSHRYDGLYRGKVVDNNDPSKLGRVKVEIWPMFVGIPTADLPWCVPMFPIFEGSRSGIGYFAVPRINSLVYCIFEEGNVYQPIVVGEAPSGVHGLPVSRETNYPDRKVVRTTNGIEIYIDDHDIVLKVIHPKGTTIEVNNDGDILKTSFRDIITTVGRNFYATVVNLASIIDLHGEKLCQTGDVKPTYATSQSGWLLLVPNTIGKTGSGATYTGEMYRALFEVLKNVYPNTGTENFDSGNKVTLPDYRGRSPVGLDNMGGSQANVLSAANVPNRNVAGGLIGEETHLLTGQESGIQQHLHSIAAYANSLPTYGGDKMPASGGNTTTNTNTTGHTDAINAHNTVQPGTMTNWMVKI